jgi:hypothetical protein
MTSVRAALVVGALLLAMMFVELLRSSQCL